MFKKIKDWVTNENSQVSNETALFILLVVGLVLGIGVLLGPYLKNGYNALMNRFQDATEGNNLDCDNALGGCDGWDTYESGE